MTKAQYFSPEMTNVENIFIGIEPDEQSDEHYAPNITITIMHSYSIKEKIIIKKHTVAYYALLSYFEMSLFFPQNT